MVSNGYTLDAVYGNGIWSYDYNSGRFTHLTSAIPTTMDLGAPDLFASFNTPTAKGTYSYDGSWHKLSNIIGFKIAAIGPGAFQEFVGGNGLFEYQSYNNSWTREAIPGGSTSFHTMGVSGYTTVISLNNGTFVSDDMGQNWTKISNGEAGQIAMIDTDDFYVTLPNGTYRCTNDRLSGIWSTPAQAIGAGSPGYDQYQLLGSWSNGTFTNLNGHWTRISTAEASLIA
jgi:hypothetical protein